VLTAIQYRILKAISAGGRDIRDAPESTNRPKLAAHLGNAFLERIAGRVVVDFGCGEGDHAVEMAKHGARRVIGVDIREEVLAAARQKAAAAGVSGICQFAATADESADLVVSVDAFEHFADPGGVLRIMDAILRPRGEVHISFGPTWYHPVGGHLFSVFPWAHLLFSEKALIRWRSDFKSDGATRFGEVAGGLNQMSIAKFEKLVRESPFNVASLELLPIRRLRALHNRRTREFTTAIVRCRLVKPL
jgi:SAM-dependent methyltransferase